MKRRKPNRTKQIVKPPKQQPKPIEPQKPSLTQSLTKKVKSKFANKRSEAQIEADLVFFEHWHIRGCSERKLSEMISAERPYTLTRDQVHQDLKKLNERWKAESLQDIATAKNAALKGLQEYEKELWAAWEKSKQDAVTQSVERGGSGTGKDGTKAKKTVHGQTGDPAFMRLLLEVQERKAKLMGFDAPTKQEFSGPNGGPIETQETLDLSNIPKDRLKEMLEFVENGTRNAKSNGTSISGHKDSA